MKHIKHFRFLSIKCLYVLFTNCSEEVINNDLIYFDENGVIIKASEDAVVGEINSLIETKCITEITFVLSDNNQMIMDALKNQRFNKVKGLKRFYNAITRQKNCEEGVRQIVDIRIPIISYYLNIK